MPQPVMPPRVAVFVMIPWMVPGRLRLIPIVMNIIIMKVVVMIAYVLKVVLIQDVVLTRPRINRRLSRTRLHRLVGWGYCQGALSG